MTGIKIYLDYGFLPVVEKKEDSRVRIHLFNELGHNWSFDQSRILSYLSHRDGLVSSIVIRYKLYSSPS
ncbi:hypothetical protein [Endozoicomonas numazuensis]|uniref:Uncharacterized protein n=1 Tax=Endozoicomonas numazuensis TaxID=1137799 RepID=A0A081NJY2_9GAMM|nr:hypothetical protein [Endozoicomonas numazuensis]KEQ18755.1 hypothetical protein GZ78_01275 [Endozoicomonas numazuensis]